MTTNVTDKHQFTRPGQVRADLPVPDACMQCGAPEADHRAPVAGPIETEQQARELPAVRAIHAAMRARTGVITPEQRAAIEAMNSALITEACSAAGVQLGTYDARIVAWLGGWEPQTCAVVAGLITRAAAGPPALRGGQRPGPRQAPPSRLPPPHPG